jgi:hypothetical protein
MIQTFASAFAAIGMQMSESDHEHARDKTRLDPMSEDAADAMRDIAEEAALLRGHGR